MASVVNAAFCALVATAFFTAFGYAIGRHVLPRALALGAAPVVGWAMFSAATLPVLTLIGFSAPAVAAMAALFLIIGGGVLLTQNANDEAAQKPIVPLWAYPAAGLLALVPASAIAPKISAAGVQLADPIFDHAKIAIIDAMTRQGLPPVDPVFGATVGAMSAPGRLAYYYLWHFSAAELALPLHISGWEADIGLTWFTAFASLDLDDGLSPSGSASDQAPRSWWSLSPRRHRCATTLSFLFGSFSLEPFMASPNGFAGWLFQSAWVPQHLMSASCVVAAMVLIVHYAQRPSAARFLTLVLIVVAGFESSAFVGGVTFAVAALLAAPILFAAVTPARRLTVVGGLGAAAVLALLIAAPFLRDQLAAVAARGDGQPDRRRSFRRARRYVSAHAAPRTRSAGLLAHSAADRISGDLYRGLDCARRDAADAAAGAGKNRRRDLPRAGRRRARRVVAPGQHASATTTISACARSCRPPWS